MKVLLTKDQIIKKSRRIRTNPSSSSIKSLKFKRDNDYNRFVKWISSSDVALKKVKLPTKKEVEGLSQLTGSSASGFGELLAYLTFLKLQEGGPIENLAKKIGRGSTVAGSAILGATLAGGAYGAYRASKLTKPLVEKGVSKLSSKLIKKSIPSTGSRTVKTSKVLDSANRTGGRKIQKKLTKRVITEGGETLLETTAKTASKTANTKLAKLGVKGGSKGLGALPLIGNLWDLGSAVYRFNDGDTVGGMLSLGSAIPILGWGVAAVDMARDMGAFDGSPFGLDSFEKSKRDKELGIETTKELEKIKLRGPKSFFVSPIIEKFGLAVDDFADIISSEPNTTANSMTQKKSDENSKIKKTSSGISSNFLGGSIPKVNTPSRVVRNGGSVVQKEGNPFKRFWNWFVPPPEKSAEPSVRSGVRTPDTGFKHVPSMSGDQLFGSGNTIIMVPENQSSVQPQSKGGIIPVPIASGGGGGGVAVVTPSESEIVNSLWTNILLTKLAQ